MLPLLVVRPPLVVSANCLCCANQETHSPWFLNCVVGSAGAPGSAVSESPLNVTLVVAPFTGVVLLALVAAYAPAAPSVSAPAATTPATFTFEIAEIRNIAFRSSYEWDR
ncbi:MAG: hypothetical protein E6I22_03145 [Chloroflexi bacterium]|nr:MAG: hypothetical protein E6I22_03145 [Chloroflexota bacterium]